MVSGGEPLKVVKDELYHVSTQKMREWVGECNQADHRIHLEPAPTQESTSGNLVAPVNNASVTSPPTTCFGRQMKSGQKVVFTG
jgi:hypothetical protein